MALIKCKECGNDVSNTAKACPNCGAKVPKSSGCSTTIIVVLVFFILFLVGLSTCSDRNPRRSYSSSESRLSKSPEDITAQCFDEAGLKENDPSHKITPAEMNKVLECSARYIKK
ncbi:MAG: zinc ribbon domain-containing protein [Methylomicrobium sp.]|nr:zinc ribbon domain-containing protein [Methylomicrobium sp.]